jgi:hypothetical protein
VAANISMTGIRLVRRSTAGLMDHALGPDEQRQIAEALAHFDDGGMRFHAVRTRQGARRAFASLQILMGYFAQFAATSLQHRGVRSHLPCRRSRVRGPSAAPPPFATRVLAHADVGSARLDRP